jgi:hypothetical protein
MILTSPLMLLGLLALPALAAIYWFRSRSRRVVVSNLAFWMDPNRPRHGGQVLHRMQTPLTLFLELLTITMLVVAAAGPSLVQRDYLRPLVVVLDDSFSMQAKLDMASAESVRDRAQKALADELGRNAYTARFIVAGVQPRLLGESATDATRMVEAVSPWTCQSPSSDLPSATTLAAEVGGVTARILVLSDHSPPMKLDTGKIEWWAFGEKQPNVAITAATRTASGENERVLLEIARLSDDTGPTTLMIEGGDLASPQKSSIHLGAGVARQIILNLRTGAPPLHAKLGNDALGIDNEVLLLTGSAKPLRVMVDLGDANLRRAVMQAFDATGQTIESSERPDLIVSDSTASCDGSSWRWEILGVKSSPAYTGPFVVDRNHPLAQGLSLQNAIWSASSETKPSGSWIVSAGNVPLLTDLADLSGRHRLQMRLSADRSNLLDTPDWPILVTNVVQWRRGGLPGPAISNARLGQTVSVALAADVKHVDVILPDGSRHKSDVHGRQVAVSADRVGRYSIKTPGADYEFSCNAVSRDESDLTESKTARWGDWNESPDYRDRRISLSWVCLLVAFMAMTVHMGIITKSVRGAGL